MIELPGTIKEREYGKFRPSRRGPAVATINIREPLDPDFLLFLTEESTTEPGVEFPVLEYVVPANQRFDVTEVRVSCRAEGRYAFRINSKLLDTGRTGAAIPNASRIFSVLPYAFEGDVVGVYFLAGAQTAPNGIEAFLSGYKTPINEEV